MLATISKFKYNCLANLGRLAQLVERFAYIEEVGGSNPSATTKKSGCSSSVERSLWEREALRSIPGTPTGFPI